MALAPHPILDAPVATAADVRLGSAGWPCHSCAETVPLDLPSCPACGSGFLASARSSVSLVLPGVGDVAQMSKGARVAVMAGGAIAVTLVLFLAFLVLGHLV